jgi:hypothetical protein
MAASAERLLPISLQHEVNSKAYAALPLCVALAHGARSWVDHRFVQICGYQLDSRPEQVLDYCDSFAYEDLLGTETIAREAAEDLALPEFIVAMVDAGRYPVVMIDNIALTGAYPTIREFLVHGYADGGRTVHAAGFGADTRFATHAFAMAEFEALFRSGLAKMRELKRLEGMSAVVHVLTPPAADEVFHPDRVRAELTAYLASTPRPGYDPHQGWWWYSRADDIGRDAPVRFGVDAHEHVARHLDQCVDRPDAWLNYPMFHMYFEHKKIVLNRLSMLAADGGGPDRAEALRSYEALVARADRFRIRMLMFAEQGKPITRQFADGFGEMQSAEAPILTHYLKGERSSRG